LRAPAEHRQAEQKDNEPNYKTHPGSHFHVGQKTARNDHSQLRRCLKECSLQQRRLNEARAMATDFSRHAPKHPAPGCGATSWIPGLATRQRRNGTAEKQSSCKPESAANPGGFQDARAGIAASPEKLGDPDSAYLMLQPQLVQTTPPTVGVLTSGTICRRVKRRK
jgi:hypothetical protein